MGPLRDRTIRLINGVKRWFYPRPPVLPVEEYYDGLSVESLLNTFESEEKAERVSLGVLLQLATLRAPELQIDQEKRNLAERFIHPLTRKWKEASGGEVAAFAPIGIVGLYRKPDMQLRISLSGVGAPQFDWGEGRELLNRADKIARLVPTWLPNPNQREPYFENCYGLVTDVFAALRSEQWRQRKGSIGTDEPPSDFLQKDLRHARERLADTEKALELGAMDVARDVYLEGMLIGAVVLGALVGIGGLILAQQHAPLVDVIAFPAGAVGAIIGVLTRLTSLEIDYQASRKKLRWAGAFRPLLGGVFGYVIYALLRAQLLGETLVQPPIGTGAELAFFGIFGFFAGFTERFAQDVVTGSAKRLFAALG